MIYGRIYTFYTNYRGGVNNLQVAHVVVLGQRVKVFTSLKDRAENYARSWCKKNGFEVAR